MTQEKNTVRWSVGVEAVYSYARDVTDYYNLDHLTG